jgi:zinc transporter ZupT
VDRQLARHWRATGQALYAAMLYGIGPSLGLFAAGFLYERVGIVPLWFFCALVGTAGLMVMAWAVRAPTPGQITERSRL